MNFVSFGSDAASSSGERLSPLAKFLTGALIAGGAALVLKGKHSNPKFHEGWDDGETTRRIGRESMQDVVFGRRR